MSLEDDGDRPMEDDRDRPMDLDAPEAKALLRRLAGADAEVVVERAVAAVDDLERAAEFVDCVGLDELEVAIARTDDAALEARGEEALGTFRRFRAAADGELGAAGELDPAARDGDAGHFHRGRGTDLRRDGEATST